MDSKKMEGITGKFPNYEVSIKVISQENICTVGHKVGDEWVINGKDCQWKAPGICMFALASIFPTLQMMMYGGSFPWEPDSETALVACPDPRNPAVFELKRTGKV